MMRFVIPVVLLGGFLLLLFKGLGLNPSEVPSPLIGKPAPQYELPDLLQPEQLISHQDLLGQPYLLNVWASWCAACAIEHPLLVKLAQNNVPIVGLNYKDTPEEAKKWLKYRGNPYQVVLNDANGRVGIEWGVYGVPETFVVDAEGIIRYKHTGPVSLDDWIEKISPALLSAAQQSDTQGAS